MNLNQASIVLRRRGGLEIVDLALITVRSLAPRETLRLLAWVVLPSYLLCLSGWYMEVPWIFIWLTALALTRLVELPFLHLMGTLLFDAETTAKVALRAAGLSIWRYCGSVIIYWCFLTCGALVLLGWFWVGGRYFYLPAVTVLEQARPLAARRRAVQLVHGRDSAALQMMFTHLLLRAAGVVFAEILGQACLEYVLDVHTQVDSLFEHGGSIFALFGLFAVAPYSATFQFLAYTNERTIQDGWDVQVRFFGLTKGTELGARRAA